jgi:hypothetical protein
MSDHISRDRVIRAGRRAGILEVVKESVGENAIEAFEECSVLVPCPFCGEKAMVIDMASNRYECKACEEEGDSVDWVMNKGFTLEEAVVKLEKMEL